MSVSHQHNHAAHRKTDPNLRALLRRIYDLPGVAETVSLDHIKRHYFCSHRTINPTGIVPRGPEVWV